MARRVSVYLEEDLNFVRSPPSDLTSTEFDCWFGEANRRCLCDVPMGSESAVREFWSAPSQLLGLPLLASIYEQGFYFGIEWRGHQLDQLEDELKKLEHYWRSLSLTVDVGGYLQERLGQLRTAVGIARSVDGVLTIG